MGEFINDFSRTDNGLDSRNTYIYILSMQIPQKAYSTSDNVHAEHMRKLLIAQCIIGDVAKHCMSYKKLYYLP